MPTPLPDPGDRPMIVTAWIAESDLLPFSALRRRFFPPERNFLDAHVTLFHHIPAGIRPAFLSETAATCACRPPFSITVGPPFLLGGGVAYPVSPEPLQAIRDPLRDRFAASLTPQDARPWKRPHLTVQNKVSPETAHRLHRHLTDHFQPCDLRVRGLECYTYDGGPWSLITRLPFGKP